MLCSSARERVPSSATWIGLFIALFGILIARWIVGLFDSALSFNATLWKESLIWVCVITLLIIVRRAEHLPLSSINIGTAPLRRSILWGGIIAVLCAIVGIVVISLTHFKGGELGQALSKLPLWLTILVVARAGVAEELFYRGYAIERLQALGLSRYSAGILPLLIFGFAHVTNGWANVVVALSLGAVLMLVYLWRRDLVANMIGHFLVDFVSVVLPRLVPHK
ncbi:MAG TPA: type II CAAX endopeptidase family protein [Candidatus Udaeobacter sp.]|jgi:membrane protease YdiL (CAAX protease family)|nr:type II CAAX endopeptidase family protein [Candidatus Udaeobacter sp.]